MVENGEVDSEDAKGIRERSEKEWRRNENKSNQNVKHTYTYQFLTMSIIIRYHKHILTVKEENTSKEERKKIFA